MGRAYHLDRPGMLQFAAQLIGQRAVTAIEGYAHKRKIVEHRAARAFWDLVDDGSIICTQDAEGFEIITAIQVA